MNKLEIKQDDIGFDFPTRRIIAFIENLPDQELYEILDFWNSGMTKHSFSTAPKDIKQYVIKKLQE